MTELQISLPDDLQDGLRAAVALGQCGSVEQAVIEAVGDWIGQRRLDAIPIERLRALVQEGIDSGPGENAADLFKRLREKYADPL